MDLAIKIYDMSGSDTRHSIVIDNFVAQVVPWLRGTKCRVYGDHVKYSFLRDTNETCNIIPDASINCSANIKRGTALLNIPKFVMEVISKSTEQRDRVEKKEIYREQEIEEYWIVDYVLKTVEIYLLDTAEEGKPEYYMVSKVSDKNKQDLKLYTFPMVNLDYDFLFDGVE